ncbi:MAG: hypothetical protein N2690_05195, partial [Rhodocyclaceae bacterium]|nr:hypothetical protein [Rhodocyclaceae bacterium]
SRLPWQQIEASVSQLLSRKARCGVPIPDLDLFGEAPVRVARVSNAGRPCVPLRIVIAPLNLKPAFNESDEGVVERWGATPTGQFFSVLVYFEHRSPCDARIPVKFRQLLDGLGVEERLAQTLNAAVELGLIPWRELKRVVVDTTVQPEAVAHPTDSRLLGTARAKLVQVAKHAGIEHKQTFANGRLQREIQRKASAIGQAMPETLSKAARIVHQGKGPTHRRAGPQAAQAAPGHRAHHRAAEAGSPHGLLSPQGRARGSAACRAVPGGLQRPLVAARDRQEGRALLEEVFFASRSGSGHAAWLARVRPASLRQTSPRRPASHAGDLKLNFSGVTK